MAVIKAVSSKAGIGHAIDYVTKKEKTEEKLVSGLHCEPETVKEEMQATKELWGKTDGRTYKHYVQSYHEDEEITPEQAHKNAVELSVCFLRMDAAVQFLFLRRLRLLHHCHN